MAGKLYIPTTIVQYPVSGVDYRITFEYLARRFVKVILVKDDLSETILELNTDYRFTTPTQITLNEVPVGYNKVKLMRQTSATDRLVDYHDGSILRAYDLNLSQLQTIHIAEESRDMANLAMFLDVDGTLNAGGRRIKNVGDGKNPKDAVNKRQLDAVDDKHTEWNEEQDERLDLLEESFDTSASRYIMWKYDVVNDTTNTIELPYNSMFVRVFINGVRQREGEAFTHEDNVVTFSEFLENGDIVDFEIGTEPREDDFEEVVQDLTNAVHNIVIDTNQISWTPNTLVKKNQSLQVFEHDGLFYLPNVKKLPFTTGVSFNADNWVLSELITVSYSENEGMKKFGDPVGWGAKADAFVSKKTAVASAINPSDSFILNPSRTDNTQAIQAAINTAALAANNYQQTTGNGNKTVKFHFTGDYFVGGDLLIPSEVHVDLNRSSLVGSGSNKCFTSAYINNGVVESNWGFPLEVNRVQNSVIRNGTIQSFDMGLNLRNFNEGCEISDLYFLDCGQAAYAFRCFYSSWEKCFVRATTGSSTDTRAAFHFHSYVNVQKMDRLFVEGRKTAFTLDGANLEGVDGNIMINCGAEQCETGIYLLHSLRPLTIQSCYFEKISKVAIDAGDASARQFSVKGCWFGECAKGLLTNSWDSGTFSSDNTWVDSSGTGIFVDANDLQAFGTVEIPSVRVENNGNPTIPTYYNLSSGVDIQCKNYIYNPVNGNILTKQAYTNDVAELPYTGRADTSVTGVAYCTDEKNISTGKYFVLVNTSIVKTDWTCCVYNVKITHTNGTVYSFAGRFYGDQVFEDVKNVGKTVSIQMINGMTRVVFGEFESGNYSISGVVRHM